MFKGRALAWDAGPNGEKQPADKPRDGCGQVLWDIPVRYLLAESGQSVMSGRFTLSVKWE